MSAIIWTKFFWSDWQSDPCVRLCSLAARGLWMDMLCIAGQHDPIGYVAVGGRGLDSTALARMTGGSESEVSALLAELEQNGVFSRDRHGRVYSRRMVADAKKQAAARDFGKEGGNPKLGVNYNTPGFVYLMGVRADGAYKIGISTNPRNRLKKVRAQYRGQEIAILDQAPTTNMGTTEADLHALFPSKRSGEWFFLSGADVGKIRGIFSTLKGPDRGPEKGRTKPHKPKATYQELPSEVISDANASSVVSAEPKPTCPHPDEIQIAFDGWNSLAERLGLPKARTLDAARRKAIRTRLADGGLPAWRQALAAVENSPHCRGENDRSWRADLDFVCQAKSWRRLLEGSYAGPDHITGPPVARVDSDLAARQLARLQGIQ